VSVWDLTNPTHPRRVGDPIRVPPFIDGVPVLETSPDGSRVAVGEFGGGGRTLVFDLHSHVLQRQFPGVWAGFTRDGTSLATASGSRVVLWDLATGQPRGAPLTGFSQPLPGIAFNSDNSLAAVGDLNTDSVRVFDLASGSQIGATIPQAFPMRFFADGRLAVGQGIGGNGEIRIYRVAAPPVPPIATALGNQASAPSTATGSAIWPTTYALSRFAMHGREIITQRGPGAPLLAWQASTGRPLGPVLGGAVRAQNGFYPSPDGVLLAASQADGRLEVWNLATRQRRAVVSTGTTSPYVWWMPGGRELVTSNPGGELSFWRVSESGHLTLRTHTTVEGIAPGNSTTPIVSPDGRTIALVPNGGGPAIPLVDARNGHRFRSLRGNGLLFDAAFSPDSKTLAVAVQLLQSGSQVVLRNVATGAPRGTLSLPYIPAAGGLAFVRGGAWLATTENGDVTGQAASSTRLDLWEADNLQPIGDPLTVPPDAAFLLPYRGGDKLSTGSDANNGLPLVWDMNPVNWEATACRIAGRNLSHAEWNEYLAGQPYQSTCPQWPAGA
jgi:WD40 repeat protein